MDAKGARIATDVAGNDDNLAATTTITTTTATTTMATRILV
jgi:hypothetical protein